MYKNCIKRLLDILLAAAGLAVLWLPMLAVAAAVKADSPGPALFRQRRVGRGRREFTLLKFRSMPTSAPKNVPTHLLDTAVVTLSPLQRAIRRYSIDELPQLWNILTGACSFCGPRPALPNQEDLLALRDLSGANDVRPGLTGWAQINGRDEISIGEKARLDGEYARALNAGGLRAFAMDCRCFFGTVGSVLRHEGVREGRSDHQETKTP